MLEEFYESINEALTSNDDILIKLRTLRDITQSSLQINAFRLHCLESVLNTIDNWKDQEKPWNAPPIYFNEKLNYSIRLIFWPSFYENNPHKHKTWSVTGVFHNELNIHTYTMLENPMRLKKERTIIAECGQTGYLTTGCIHNVNNASHNLSASLHIFNNINNTNQPEENAIWYPSPRKHNLSKGLIERALLTSLSVAETIQTEQAFDLIDRIYISSPLNIKIMAVKSLYQFDRTYARSRFNELEITL